MGESRSKPDQFQLRLPRGLRDRIKTYAERHGRSMNEEIVRLLEREFPETYPLSEQLTSLLELSNALKENIKNDIVSELGEALMKTVQGVASGQVPGVDDDTRRSVAAWLIDFQAELNEDHRYEFEASLDADEFETLERVGTTAKFVEPREDKK